MDLYSRAVSPYAARVRASIAAKGLNVRIIDRPDVASAEFGALNPMRRVPVLVLDDGRPLPESEAIVEYLEDTFPGVSLRPADSYQCARARLIARAAELYVFPAVIDIFKAMGTQSSDAEQLGKAVEILDAKLGELSALMSDDRRSWRAVDDSLSIADGALAPFLYYVEIISGRLSRDLLAKHPPLRQFLENCRTDPALDTVIREIGTAMGIPQP
jgi:maleylpyruvate isomerase